ncbi:MAG: bifunctional phosphoribosylaminoimidazolecarboxamide formyltransferase/IMP cyclohydrolase [Chloroflexi bacterium]|nr:bifunctional phosphoribosylaminoimidazolecarboxamide formyltransferase/IMP cyclohydrolase [Chloroflexota bacterium]
MKTALLSVWDKTGIIELAQKLAAENWRLVASGGTARALKEAGFSVTSVSEITGAPEMFEGRVKTLHPAIHAGVLARDTDSDRADLAAQGWATIDLVVVNLYPFEEVVAQPETSLAAAIENIDIGGVALLRAAAKNYSRVTVFSSPKDYPDDLARLQDESFRQKMMLKAFATTARYDNAIQSDFARRMLSQRSNLMDKEATSSQKDAPCRDKPINLTLYPVQTLRYGENPHQAAAYYATSPDASTMGGKLLQGKALSYNNLLDLDSAWNAVLNFSEPAVVVVKHLSPCGIATAFCTEDAVAPAIASDPVSAFGSVIASNREVNADFVDEMGKLFVECIVAPSFDEDARALLAKKKNLRLLELDINAPRLTHDLRAIVGGFLRQEVDTGSPKNAPELRVVTNRQPSSEEMNALNFAWKAVQPVKSNAILLAKSDGEKSYTVGIGGGQPNRVDCVRISGERAGAKAKSSVMASDAFFPFPDGVDEAAKLGVTAIIQPGGSIRDEQVIAKANELGIAMIFTGIRYFKH